MMREALLAVMGLVAAVAPVGAQVRPDPAVRKAAPGAAAPLVEQQVCRWSTDFRPGEAEVLRPAHLPALARYLGPNAPARCRPGAALGLGYLGGRTAFEHLVEVVEAAPFSEGFIDARRVALQGIALLVRRDLDATAGEALGYLIAGTEPGYWRERLRTPAGDYEARLLAASAVVALAFTGHPRAAAHLETLLHRAREAIEGLGPDSHDLVVEAIAALRPRIGRPLEDDLAESAP